jgi:hypothetical protein
MRELAGGRNPESVDWHDCFLMDPDHPDMLTVSRSFFQIFLLALKVYHSSSKTVMLFQICRTNYGEHLSALAPQPQRLVFNLCEPHKLSNTPNWVHKRMIQDNPSLVSLKLIVNSNDTILPFCQAINNNKSLGSLKVLCFNDGTLTLARTIFTQIKCPTLTHMRMAFGNDPSHLESNDFAIFLAAHPNLQWLYFDPTNTFTEHSAASMTETLRTNHTLKMIFVDVGNQHLFSHLRSAVYNPQSIKSMTDCNHVCHMLLTSQATLENPYSTIHYQINDFKDAKTNRGRKLLNLLSLRNKDWSNGSHFQREGILDNTLLFPRIVYCISKLNLHYQDMFAVNPQSLNYVVSPLSIVYEIARNFLPSVLLNRAPKEKY